MGEAIGWALVITLCMWFVLRYERPFMEGFRKGLRSEFEDDGDDTA